jgi:uncharacterized protein involved in exopolysaccharide biosynthesis
MHTGSPGEKQANLERLILRSILLSIVTAVTVAIYSLLIDNQFRATSSVILSPLPITTSESTEGSEKDPASQVNFLMAKPLTVPDYRLLLTNPEIVAHLRDRWLAILEAGGKSGKKIRLDQVRNSMHVEIRLFKQTVYDIVYQPIIELSFTANDPKVAALLANEWAEQGILLATSIDKKSEEGMIEFLKRQMDVKGEELGCVEKTIEQLEGQLILENWQNRIKELDAQATKFQTRASQLATEIADSNGQLEQLEKSLIVIPEKVTLRRALPEEAYWLLDANGKAPKSDKVFESEEINSPYGILLEKKSTKEAELNGKLAEKAAIDVEIKQLRETIETLQIEVAAHNRLYKEANREYESKELQFKQLSVNFGAAQVAEAKNVPDLKLAAHAVEPENKIGPQRTIMVCSAALLGLVIAPIFYWVAALIKQYAPTMLASSKESTHPTAPPL